MIIIDNTNILLIFIDSICGYSLSDNVRKMVFTVCDSVV